jgi:heat-inducible transcriptional repressor
MAPQNPNILNERAAILLKNLVNSYINDGQPVGSRQLAHNAGLNISSATIRNVMSALEKQGLVKAPHTSAGRIPTEQGIRFFVDTLLDVRPMESKLVKQLTAELNPDQNTESLISQATQMVSELTHMAGVITIPKPSQSVLRHIEFLPLPDKRVLAILVINEKEVQNRILHLDKNISQSELQQAANFLNEQFAGQDIFDIRQQLIKEMSKTRADMDMMMKSAIEMAGQMLDSSDQHNKQYMVQGKTNLMRYGDTQDTSQLQQLLEVFDHKREMLGLLDRCIQAEGVKIFIGHEMGIEGLGDFSVITSPYMVDGEPLGVLGVIGPTRINYDQVIPVVDVTARLLSEALKQ